jgi:hypothetical protein
MRKLGECYQAELKRLANKLLTTKSSAQETFLGSVLRNERNSWSEFYRYVRRREGNKESIPAVKDINGGNISDPARKANILNKYYASVLAASGTFR